MIIASSAGRPFRRCLTAVGVVVGVVFTGALAASAGECPANQVVADGLGQGIGASKPKDVTDTVLKRIELVNEPVMLKDHALRLRRLVIKPGGIVPWHSHTDRPAIIYIITGTIVEYRSTCKTPIVHRAGEATAEVKGTSHWWKNTGHRTVVLLSADVFHDKDDPHTM
jgi:quercetin dioxygenase-like cupin family protein